MERFFLFLTITILPCLMWSQNRKEWTPFDSTYEACLLARRSLHGEIASKEEMKEASRLFVKSFQCYNITIIDNTYNNKLDNYGHIVYLPSFFDSLTEERKIYEFAKQYRESSERRGQAKEHHIKVANKTVKKNKSLVMMYSPKSKTIDIGFVTEPLRLMTIYVEAFDKNGSKLGERIQRRDSAYKGYPDCRLDGINVPIGTAYFKITLQNKSKMDGSFVIIISD